MKTAGFGLVEVLVATAVVTVGVVSLARLFVVSGVASGTAKAISITALLAEQKMEALRGELSGPDPSPPAALSVNTDGYYEYLDARGQSLGAPGWSPPGAVYVCRWSARPLSGGRTIVLQVLVTPQTTTRGATRLVSAKRKAR